MTWYEKKSWKKADCGLKCKDVDLVSWGVNSYAGSSWISHVTLLLKYVTMLFRLLLLDDNANRAALLLSDYRFKVFIFTMLIFLVRGHVPVPAYTDLWWPMM